MSTQFTYETTILEHHLDTFGHVNNATYLEIYEEARWDFATKNGYGFDRIKTEKVGPVIVEAHIHFRRELFNREKILIRSQSTGMINTFLMGMKQWIEKSDGEVASRVEIVVGLFDLEKRALIKPTADWLSAVGETPSTTPKV